MIISEHYEFTFRSSGVALALPHFASGTDAPSLRGEIAWPIEPLIFETVCFSRYRVEGAPARIKPAPPPSD